MRRTFTRFVVTTFVVSLSALAGGQVLEREGGPAAVTLSVIGTTDLHGYFMERNGRGGLALFAGYVRNLRAARAEDGGAVLLVDAGDTFQGGVESDLSEGAVVVDAYNALGYTALAVGNHEFDFGSADRPGARQDPFGDPRGALKARAAQARFPFLAANLLDESTGQPVDWPNVRPSTLVEAGGLKVGVIGVMTAGALRATLPLNVGGLRMAPLAETIAREAARLRREGAQVVIVGAHAGGACAEFTVPADLSSCDGTAEIFDVARQLPAGLVNAIAAGHTHDGLAHEVNGIAIVQAYWGGRAFGRVDLTVDRRTGAVTAQPFAPREICATEEVDTGRCATAASGGALRPAEYAGRPVEPDGRIVAAMEPALARVRQLQATPLGVTLETPLPRAGEPESPLGNLFADALRAVTASDVALNNNSVAGLRADLPPGPLTFGRLYDAFPFDNRLLRVAMTGEALERGIVNALRRGRRGAFGISGAQVRVSCSEQGLQARLFRASGEPIGPAEIVTVAAMDMMLGGQLFGPVLPPGSLRVPHDAPILREVVEDWLRERGGAIRSAEFVDPTSRRLHFEGGSEPPCLTQ